MEGEGEGGEGRGSDQGEMMWEREGKLSKNGQNRI